MKYDDDRNSSGIFARWLRAVLTHKYLPIMLAILAMVLTLPALSVGWILEDNLQRWAMMGSSEYGEFLPTPPDIWRLFDGNPERNGRMIDAGWLPWWTYREIRWAFWRPLAALTHVFDYWLWPGRSDLMHAQSLVWFGALIGCTAVLYRRFMGVAAAAGLAGLLYALDDSHGTAVGFLANRNALLATLFGVLCLFAHDRWRRDKWRAGAVLGPILLAMSLLSAEAGIGIVAYLLAYALILDDRPLWQRIRGLIPYLLVVGVWRILWWYQGYGVQGVGIYTDPVGDPLGFLLKLPVRMPILLLGQWAIPPGEFSIFSPQNMHWVWLIAVIVLIVSAVLFIPVLKRSRVARFWAVGMILASIAPCASHPQDRQLFFVGIGAMGLLGEYLARVFSGQLRDNYSLRYRIPMVLLAIVYVVIHVLGSPVILYVRAKWPMGPQYFLDSCHALPNVDSSIEKQELIFLSHPAPGHVLYMLSARGVNEQPLPRRTRTLVSALSRMTIRRPNARTLVIRLKRGYLSEWFDKMFRSTDYPLALGERVELSGMTVEIKKLTDDGRPLEVSFRFAVPLEDPSLRWLRWKEDHFEEFVPPAVGEVIKFRRAELPF